MRLSFVWRLTPEQCLCWQIGGKRCSSIFYQKRSTRASLLNQPSSLHLLILPSWFRYSFCYAAFTLWNFILFHGVNDVKFMRIYFKEHTNGQWVCRSIVNQREQSGILLYQYHLSPFQELINRALQIVERCPTLLSNALSKLNFRKNQVYCNEMTTI